MSFTRHAAYYAQRRLPPLRLWMPRYGHAATPQRLMRVAARARCDRAMMQR